MYKIMLVFNNYELLTEIQNLDVWQNSPEFEITFIARDGYSAYREMKENKYDIVISEIRIMGMDGLQLLRSTKQENLCSHFVLCSEIPEFSYARQGIILGAFDYFVTPFDEQLFLAMFERIKNETGENSKNETESTDYSGQLMTYFENRDEGIYQRIEEMLDKIYSRSADSITADKKVRQILNTVITRIFDSNEWLDLYLDEKEFETMDGIHEGNHFSYRKHYGDMLGKLFREYCELLPGVHNETIHEVMLYILNNPESDLRQKTVAAQFYMNSSYLSTIFMANTEMLFVDYLTCVKLKRTAILLKKTNIKIADIADRLGYKDVGYFSRIFKKRYGITPSDYRMSEVDDYQI